MDSSKSCWFVTVKYVLISILLVNFVNLMVALSSGISETDKNKQTEIKESVTTKKILETVRLVTTLISVIFGLVGVSRESFCLSITTGIMMILETVATFFGDFDASTIVSMVFNTLIALTTFAFAYMCKAGMNVFNTAQIEPIMVARNRTASKCPSVVVNFTDDKSNSSDPPQTATTNDESTSVQLPNDQRPSPEDGGEKQETLQVDSMEPRELPASIPEDSAVTISEEPNEAIPEEPKITIPQDQITTITEEPMETTPLDPKEPLDDVKGDLSSSSEVNGQVIKEINQDPPQSS